MKSCQKFILKVVIFINFMVPVAQADTVVLKNGRKLNVEKVWVEGDQFCFIFRGIKAGIPQSKVARVETDSDDRNNTDSPNDKTKEFLKRVGRKPDQDVRQGQPEDITQAEADAPGTARPTPSCSALRRDGFCDLHWERRVSSVAGLKKKQTISDLDDVVEYVRPNEITKIGDATLASVIYSFWRDQLYTVTVWTKGYANFTALRDAALEGFGPGIRNDFARERYLWSDSVSDIMLDYIPDGQYGMLWLRSKELDRQCRSSQLKGHTSYLKWMRSRAQKFHPTLP